MNRNGIIAAVVTALLIVGAVYAYQTFFKTHNAMQLTAACAKSTCDWAGAVSLQPGDQWPGKCPKCGDNTVLDLATCSKCGNRQIMNEQLIALLPEYKTLDPLTRCKNCNAAIKR